MGSNGLTAARHLLLSHEYAEKYPETYSPTIDISKVYCGKYKVGDKLPGCDVDVIDAILSPTRTYAPIIRDILAQSAIRYTNHPLHRWWSGQVRGFGDRIHYIKDSLFDIPPLFAAIYENGDISASEMYQVFNMGHRMELYCDEATASFVIETAKKYRVDAKIVGYTEASRDERNHVSIRSELGSFEY